MKCKIFNTLIVKDYIKSNKLSIKEFCKRCKISNYAYYQFMNNDLKISVPKVFRIAYTLNIEVKDLFKNETNN